MGAKAKRYSAPEDGHVADERGTTGVSILFVPDKTFRLLSDAAAERGTSVAALIADAVDKYLNPPQPTKQEDLPEPARRGKPVLKGFR